MGMTFAEVAQLWLLDVEATCKPRTKHTYAIAVSKILRMIPALRERWITRADLLCFRAARLKVSAFTANKDVRALRRCINWSKLLDTPPPAVQLAQLLLKEPRSPDRTLQPAQIEKLFAEAAFDVPVLAVLRVCFGTGLRLGEATSLQWQNIDFGRGTVSVSPKANWTAKTTASYRIVKAPALVAWLARYQRTLRFKGPEDPVCQMDLLRGKPWTACIYPRMRVVFKRAGISGRQKTHALRHTLATELAEGGVPVHLTQAMLGHATSNMTLDIYTHVRPLAMESAGDLLEKLRADRYGELFSSTPEPDKKI